MTSDDEADFRILPVEIEICISLIGTYQRHIHVSSQTIFVGLTVQHDIMFFRCDCSHVIAEIVWLDILDEFFRRCCRRNLSEDSFNILTRLP